jgi:hypothetical protein
MDLCGPIVPPSILLANQKKSLHNFRSRHFCLWQTGFTAMLHQIFMINVFNCVLMNITRKVSSIGKGGTRLHKAHLPEFCLSVHTEPGKVDLNATVVARAICPAV